MNILVVLSRFPYPTDKGDKLRAYYQLKHLSKRHNIYLVCTTKRKISEAERKEVKKYCKELHIIQFNPATRVLQLSKTLLNGKPFQVNYFRSFKCRKRIKKILRSKHIDIIYAQLVRVIENIPDKPGVPLFLDYMDSFSLGMKKRATVSSWYEKPVIQSEMKRLIKYENYVFERFEGCSIITGKDLTHFDPDFHDRISVVPNGVSFDKFKPGLVDRDIDLIFTGNMGYHPNIQAVKFLANQIMPALRKKGLDPVLYIVGVNPAKEVLKVQSEKVIVTGFVEDVKEYLNRSKIFVAPLFTGSGLQNKLLEAMACEVATVTTPLANMALKATDGKEILICEDLNNFVNSILFLLENPDKSREIALKANEFVHKHFDWETQNRQLEKLLYETAGVNEKEET